MGQNEAQLQQKIRELLEQGTRYIWVVRLGKMPHVEVYEPGRKKPNASYWRSALAFADWHKCGRWMKRN